MPAHPWTERRRYLAELKANLVRAYRSRSGHCDQKEYAIAALITAAYLGIDTTTDQGLFDWLLASMLFRRPVPQKAAASAFRKFKEDGWNTRTT